MSDRGTDYDDVIGEAIRDAFMNAIAEVELAKADDWEFWMIGNDKNDLMAPGLISPSLKKVLGYDLRIFPFAFPYKKFVDDPNCFKIGAL